MNYKQLHRRHVGRAKVLHAQGRIESETLGAIVSGRGELREYVGDVVIEGGARDRYFDLGYRVEYIRPKA